MTAIFRMAEDDRASVASRYVGRWVTVRWNAMRNAHENDYVFSGYLVSMARVPGAALLIVLSPRLTADGIGDAALPLSQVRSITPTERGRR